MLRTVEAHEPQAPDASQGTRETITASPGGPMHGGPGGLARLPAAQRAAAVLAMQAGHGNAAVARMLQRAPAEGARCPCGGTIGPDGQCDRCRERREAEQEGRTVAREPAEPEPPRPAPKPPAPSPAHDFPLAAPATSSAPAADESARNAAPAPVPQAHSPPVAADGSQTSNADVPAVPAASGAAAPTGTPTSVLNSVLEARTAFHADVAGIVATLAQPLVASLPTAPATAPPEAPPLPDAPAPDVAQVGVAGDRLDGSAAEQVAASVLQLASGAVSALGLDGLAASLRGTRPGEESTSAAAAVVPPPAPPASGPAPIPAAERDPRLLPGLLAQGARMGASVGPLLAGVRARVAALLGLDAPIRANLATETEAATRSAHEEATRAAEAADGALTGTATQAGEAMTRAGEEGAGTVRAAAREADQQASAARTGEQGFGDALLEGASRLLDAAKQGISALAGALTGQLRQLAGKVAGTVRSIATRARETATRIVITARAAITRAVEAGRAAVSRALNAASKAMERSFSGDVKAGNTSLMDALGIVLLQLGRFDLEIPGFTLVDGVAIEPRKLFNEVTDWHYMPPPIPLEFFEIPLEAMLFERGGVTAGVHGGLLGPISLRPTELSLHPIVTREPFSVEYVGRGRASAEATASVDVGMTSHIDLLVRLSTILTAEMVEVASAVIGVRLPLRVPGRATGEVTLDLVYEKGELAAKDAERLDICLRPELSFEPVLKEFKFLNFKAPSEDDDPTPFCEDLEDEDEDKPKPPAPDGPVNPKHAEKVKKAQAKADEWTKTLASMKVHTWTTSHCWNFKYSIAEELEKRREQPKEGGTGAEHDLAKALREALGGKFRENAQAAVGGGGAGGGSSSAAAEPGGPLKKSKGAKVCRPRDPYRMPKAPPGRPRLMIPAEKGFNLAEYQKLVKERILVGHPDFERKEFEAQDSVWMEGLDDNWSAEEHARWAKKLADEGRPPRTLYVPDWSRRGALGMLYDIDHVVELQVLMDKGGPTWPLADQVENMQLLEHGQNRAAGPKLRARIKEEREDLFTMDQDPRWATCRLEFASVAAEGTEKMEGWMFDEVRTFKHMKLRP